MQQYPKKKSIVHILWDFGSSGAHIFAVNLANEQAKDYNVTLINLHPQRVTPILLNRIDPAVRVVNLEGNRWARGASYKIGHFLSGMKHNNSLYVYVMAKELAKLMKGADIVHTHLVRDRYIVSKAMEMMGKGAPRHVMTDHGGYLGVVNKEKIGKQFPEYSKKVLDHIMQSCAYVVTISDPQNAYWRGKQEEGYRITYSKIYNGNPSEIKDPKSRQELGYGENDFIFVMVARGVERAKGWEVTINAFLKYNDPDAKLMLVGAGKEVDRLKVIHGGNPGINFTGAVQNPADLIHVADVGVLATTYGAESLPNSVIEYLKAGLPVIASDTGDIKHMLQIGKHEAGILLPIEQNQIDVTVYAEAMKKMQHDKAAYAYFRNNAKETGKQYNMAYCAHRYATEVYGFDVLQEAF